MNREYHKWYSPALQRDMELLTFGTGGARVLVFPTRKQRFFEYEDHGMIQALQRKIEAQEIQVICVDGIDGESLYCFDRMPDERIGQHLAYERYVMDEVLPFSSRMAPGTPLIAHGCSFGAYHALAIAVRNPAWFSRVVALSGRYDLTLDSGDFHTLFHGFYGDRLKEINPSHFLPEMQESKQLRLIRRIKFTLVVGEEDPFYGNNATLIEAMELLRIKNEFHVWCGNAHRFRYWRQMARIYL